MTLRRIYLLKPLVDAIAGCFNLLWVVTIVGLGGPSSIAQEIRLSRPMRVQDVAIQQEPDQQGEERAITFQRWIRGFIQNELHLIEHVCKPSPELAQRLVDTAETEWKSRLSNSIRAYVEAQNQRISTDIEARIERLVQIWVRDNLPEAQQQQWQQEIDARLAYRKRIVIGRMVGEAERKFGLTFSQMRDVEFALKERWKDSWWSMYRSGTLPETKFAWISKILSDSQRTGGTDRNTPFSESFVSGTSIDMPSLDVHERFRLGDVSSSSSIPLRLDDVHDNRMQPDATGPLLLEPSTKSSR